MKNQTTAPTMNSFTSGDRPGEPLPPDELPQE